MIQNSLLSHTTNEVIFVYKFHLCLFWENEKKKRCFLLPGNRHKGWRGLALECSCLLYKEKGMQTGSHLTPLERTEKTKGKSQRSPNHSLYAKMKSSSCCWLPTHWFWRDLLIRLSYLLANICYMQSNSR